MENVNEASVIGGMELYGIRDLRHLLEVLSGKLPMQAESTINMDELQNSMNRYEVDFSELIRSAAAQKSSRGGGSWKT